MRMDWGIWALIGGLAGTMSSMLRVTVVGLFLLDTLVFCYVATLSLVKQMIANLSMATRG
jgi:hypothetical protein